MDQKPVFNNAFITVQLSPGCCEETLNTVIELLRTNGVSHVKLDSGNMRVCIQSAMNPFTIVDVIKKVDAGADLFMYSKEEPLAGNSHRKSGPKNHKQTNGYKEEKRGMEDDQNGRNYHNKQPEYGCKKQMPNAKEDGDFEDVKDPRNVRRYPNVSKEHKRNAKRDEDSAPHQHYSSRDHRGKCHYNHQPEEYVCQNDREYSNQQAPPFGAFSRSQSYRFDGTSSQQRFPPQPHYQGYSSRNHNGEGYYNHHPQEYVCKNDREDRNQKAPPQVFHVPSGAYSRDNLRSQSCRFDGRNSQQPPPPQSHNPGYTQNTRYDSPSDSHHARNSHYQKNEYDAPQAEPHHARNSHHQKNEFNAPQAEPHYARNSHYQENDSPQAHPHYPPQRPASYEEHHNHHSNMAQPSYDYNSPQAHPHYPPQRPASYEEHHTHHPDMAQPSYDYNHLHQNPQPYGYEPRGNCDMPFHYDYHMGENSHGCNIL